MFSCLYRRMHFFKLIWEISCLLGFSVIILCGHIAGSKSIKHCHFEFEDELSVRAGGVTTVDIMAMDSGIDQRKEPNNGVFSEQRRKSLQARYGYGIIFLLMNLVAWLVRDYGQKFLPELHCKLIYHFSH